MGWTSYHANYYKNGKVDKKKECDSYFIEGLNKGFYKINKSSMVGNIYYAAITALKKYDKDKNIVDIPELEQKTFAVVFVTSVRNKDYYNFAYKNMDETEGPYYYDCPKKVLDALSPIDDAYANLWREKCRLNIKTKKEQKQNPNSLKNLPEGTIIEVILPCDTTLFKKGNVIKMVKTKISNKIYWIANNYTRFSRSLMQTIQNNNSYKILQKGGEI